MPSKILPWEYIEQYPEILPKRDESRALLMPDHFTSRLVLNHIKKDTKRNLLLGKEASLTWLEDHILTPSLFSEELTYLVIHAEDCDLKLFEKLNEQSHLCGNRILFLFHKSNTVFKKIEKLKNIDVFSLNMPPFWENRKILDFVAREFSIALPTAVSEYILESRENTVEDFFYCVNLIKQSFPKEIPKDLSKITTLFDESYLNHFKFAEHYGNKRLRDFYYEILPFCESFEPLRGLFSFMQGHLIKMSDNSYINKKIRPSNYDKAIVRQSQAWTPEQIQKSVCLFSELEVLAKSKSNLLPTKLRSLYLKCLA